MCHHAIWTEKLITIVTTRYSASFSGFAACATDATGATGATQSAARARIFARFWCVEAQVAAVDVADRRIASRRRAAAHRYWGQRDRGPEGICARFQWGCRRGHLQSTGIPANKNHQYLYRVSLLSYIHDYYYIIIDYYFNDTKFCCIWNILTIISLVLSFYLKSTCLYTFF